MAAAMFHRHSELALMAVAAVEELPPASVAVQPSSSHRS